MNYHSVKDRCAADISGMQLPITIHQSLEILRNKGFREIEVDLIKIARTCIGRSKYQRGGKIAQAPEVFDCSSLIKWLYGQKGIWLPRRSIQQREFGEIIDPTDTIAEDVVFVSGFIDYYFDDPADGVGHVGIATGEGSVIHAAGPRAGIVESSFNEFTQGKFRGIRRMIPLQGDVRTFITPPEREVECTDDLRWIILQNL